MKQVDDRAGLAAPERGFEQTDIRPRPPWPDVAPATVDEPPTTMQLATLALPRPTRLKHGRGLRRSAATLLLVAYDALWLNVAFLIAYFVRFDVFRGITFVSRSPFVAASFETLWPFHLALVASMLLLLAVRGMYRLRATGTALRQFSALFTSAAIGFALYSIYEFLLRSTPYVMAANTRAVVIFAWGAAVVVPFAGRLLLGFAIALAFRLGVGRARLVVIGSGRAGKLVLQHFAALPSLGMQVVGFVQDRGDGQADFGRFKALGMLDDLEAILRAQRASQAVIALPSSRQGEIARCVRICERNAVAFRLVPDLQEFSLTRFDVEMIAGLPLITLRRLPPSDWQRGAKRALDVAGAALGLALGAPLWLLIALLVRLDSPGPALYRQTRIGRFGQPFTTYKFRSMYLDADARRAALATDNYAGRGLFKLRRDPRVTRVGRVLRRASLDEIPQLWNVLRGEMSLVGPRPPMPDEYARYEDWEKRRLEVLPGLTGLWQVRGRSDISFEEMVLMDLYYVENWSLGLDMQLLLKTLPVVVFGRGAY